MKNQTFAMKASRIYNSFMTAMSAARETTTPKVTFPVIDEDKPIIRDADDGLELVAFARRGRGRE